VPRDAGDLEHLVDLGRAPDDDEAPSAGTQELVGHEHGPQTRGVDEGQLPQVEDVCRRLRGTLQRKRPLEPVNARQVEFA
jgi:hypothetical protein